MPEGRLYSLLIGINQYDSPAVRNLAFAVADVEELRSWMTRRVGLQEDHCITLASPCADPANQPTRLRVLKALEQFARAPIGNDDTFLLYFGGHGFATEEATYLLAADSDPTSHIMLAETALSLHTVQRYLREIQAGQQILILDACRNEPMNARRALGGEEFNPVMARDIAVMASEKSEGSQMQRRAVLSACWQGQVAYEYLAGEHGWFCYNLIWALNKAPAGEIDFGTLLEDVRGRMQAEAWKVLPEAAGQTPHLLLEGGSVRLPAGPLVAGGAMTDGQSLERGKREPGDAYAQQSAGSAESTRNQLQIVLNTGHPLLATAVSIDPSGRWIVSGTGDGRLCVWEADSWTLVRSWKGHSGSVSAIAMSSDGRWVLSACKDDAVRLWDATNGTLSRSIDAGRHEPAEVAIAPDGRWIACLLPTLMVVDTATGGVVRPHESGSPYAFSPDGKLLASGSGSHAVQIFETATGQLVHRLDRHRLWVHTCRFSPDGRWVASGGADNELMLWDLSTGQHVHSLDHSDSVFAAAFSRDSRSVVTGSRDRKVRLWDTASGALLRSFEGHSDAVTEVGFTAGDRCVVSAGRDRTLKLWELSSGRVVCSSPAKESLTPSGISAAAWSRDGRWIVSGNRDGTLRLWEADTGRLARSLEGHSEDVRAVAFSPDTRYLASGSGDGSLIVWELANGRPLHSLQGRSGRQSVAFAPDGASLVSGHGSSIEIWDVKTGRLLRSWHNGNSLASWNVSAVSFSVDGRTVASGGSNRLYLWEAATGKLIHAWEHGESDVHCEVKLAYLPDGQWLVSACKDSTRTWEAGTGAFKDNVMRHAASASAVAVSPNGRWIAAGLRNGTLQLKAQHPLEGRSIPGAHWKAVSAVLFSPDRRWIASAAEDGTLKLWTLSGDLALTMMAVDFDGFVCHTPEGRYICSEGAEEKIHFVQGLKLIEDPQVKQRHLVRNPSGRWWRR